jgi:hypothetical protein
VVVAIVFILAAAWYYAVLRGRLRRGEAGVAQLDEATKPPQQLSV